MRAEHTASSSPLPSALEDLSDLRRHARGAEEWPAPRLVPTTYPGAAPDYDYLLVGDQVLPIAVQVDGSSLRARLPDGSPVDEVLARLGSAPLAERVPVLAYGANRTPHSLAVKFAHHLDDHSDQSGQPEAVPVVSVTVRDIDIVAASLSSQGCIYADMTPSPGTRASAKLTLLDREQAGAIHASEGVGQGMYDCGLLPGVELGDTTVLLSVVAYAGCVPVFVSPVTGTPLAFAAIAAAGRQFAAFEQVDMLAHVLESTGVVEAVARLLGGLGPAGADASMVARESARLLSGQWWYVHNTGDAPMAAASEVQRVVLEALGRHTAARSTSQRFAAEGQILEADVAYACGPELRLGTQLTVG